LRLAAESPSHVAGVVGHEPPALSLARDDASMSPILDEVLEQVSAIVETIPSGDHTRAAREWIDRVVHEPGAWDEMARHEREILIENAPAFLDEANGPEQLDLDVESLSAFDGPILLTAGSESLPLFPWVVHEIADAVPSARRRVFSEAGHVPHVTHPDEFVQVPREFVQQNV
jgi:pimeloyl-ACP methyl ester carboxylesterase